MKKPLLSSNEQLMKEWCWEENDKRGLDPSTISLGSGKLAIWYCSNGHKYEATINHRDTGYGCPYCCGRKVLEGFNDFACLYPKLVAEWSQRNELLPTQVTAHSGKKIIWECAQGHEWLATTSDRIEGHGCPYCSGRKAISGKNDLLTLRPDLVAEWDYDKNTAINIANIKPGSKTVVWWKCRKGHSWESSVKNRSAGHNCPFCAGHKLIPSEVRFSSTVLSPAGKKIYRHNGSLEQKDAILHKRINILEQKTFASVCPRAAEEWNYQKNGSLTPDNVFPYSNKIVWWKGHCGHEWQDSIGHRTAGRNCPIYNKRNRTSFPEQAIFYYISLCFPDAENGFRGIFDDGMEIDIYIPSRKIGIEYDGIAWHTGQAAYNRELRKYQKCKENGIFLIRIKEKPNLFQDMLVCDVLYDVESGLKSTIDKVLKYLSVYQDVDIDRDRIIIQERYLSAFTQNSLEAKCPELVKEWHPSKNGSLKPNMFSPGSGEAIWWRCSKGHEWKELIRERAVAGTGCPYCSNHRLLCGFNDLETIAPQIAKEWNYHKNGEITPKNILASSTKKVWWICQHQHEWEISIRERVRRNLSCPYCRGKKAWQGFNDISTTHPELLVEWHSEKNMPTTPEMFTRGSNKKVWWICSVCGHEWQAPINARSSGSGCPKCANQRRAKNLKNHSKDSSN